MRIIVFNSDDKAKETNLLDQLKETNQLIYTINLYNKVDELSKILYNKRSHRISKEISNIAEEYYKAFFNDVVKNINDKKDRNIDCVFFIRTDNDSTIDSIKSIYGTIDIY